MARRAIRGGKDSTERQRLALAQYLRRRNGVPLGKSGSLRNMLHRSLGAGTFAGFWQYWNPVFGYGLARYVDAPLRRVLPSAVALIMTFVVCGLFHDLIATSIRRAATFPFSTWFLLLGIGVVLGRAVGMDLSKRPWATRACANLTYLGTCLALAILARRALGIP